MSFQLVLAKLHIQVPTSLLIMMFFVGCVCSLFRMLLSVAPAWMLSPIRKGNNHPHGAYVAHLTLLLVAL
jgi:hypothetical protein